MKTRRQITSRPRVEELEGRLVPSTLTTSGNWSGYAVLTGLDAVTSVSGTWVVPTIQNTANGSSSAWVGIDGYNSPTVEQIGTEMDYSHGKATYYAWYEMYPNWSVELPLTISAGNTISASVSYSANKYSLTLTDMTTGKSYNTVQTAAGLQRSSAEWIVEAPSNGYSILPLDNFGTIQFSNALAAVNNGTPASISAVTGGAGVEQINMVNDQGAVTGDMTSALTSSGTGFSVTATVGSTSPSPSPTPPGHHRGGGGGGGWGWWWGTNSPVPPTTVPPAAFAVAATINATAPGTITPLPVHAIPGVTTALGTTPASIATPSVTAITAQSSAALAGNSDPTAGSAAPGTDKPAPELLPAPNVSDEPGNATMPPAPANPASDDLPASLEGSTVDWRACDACFAQQRWEPAPALEGARAAAVKADDEGVGSRAAAGVVALLALGGAWSIVVDQPAARRYKQRPLVRR